jgi:hypothetical protein
LLGLFLNPEDEGSTFLWNKWLSTNCTLHPIRQNSSLLLLVPVTSRFKRKDQPNCGRQFIYLGTGIQMHCTKPLLEKVFAKMKCEILIIICFLLSNFQIRRSHVIFGYMQYIILNRLRLQLNDAVPDNLQFAKLRTPCWSTHQHAMPSSDIYFTIL